MKKIIALTDYKNKFGSKHFDVPYRSGMDKNILKKYFNELGFEIDFIQFTKLLNNASLINRKAYYIYTSSEDIGYYYKSFIEDVVLYLEEIGCRMIPKYKYLRANNNKVFMELLRNATTDDSLLSIHSHTFGTMEEAWANHQKFCYPVVVKMSEGASGTGVYKAENSKELSYVLKKVASTKNIYHDLWDHGRFLKHKGYVKESRYRKKFIIQDMVPGLENDYKVLMYGTKCFVLKRQNRANDFRASGSGNFSYTRELPTGMLDFAYPIMLKFNVPQISMDIAFDGKKFHLIEFQFLYFGTTTIVCSEFYFKKLNNWTLMEGKSCVEKVYAESITEFVNKNY